MGIRPSEFLYFPIKHGAWLRDSQGKPRVYKSLESARKNLKTIDYDFVQIYSAEDIVSREDFEKVGSITDNLKLLKGGGTNA